MRPDLGDRDDLSDLATAPARARDQPGPRPGAQPRRRRARLGGGRPRRRPGVPRLLPRLPRPHAARRLRADAARGLPRLRARQLHLRRRARRLGLDDLQRVAVGPQLGQPAVLVEFADIVLDLANLGVEVLRLDAIAFLWKRLGTNCQNQPEVHAITQALRAVARIAAPAVAFKAEAIVGPHHLVPYLGTGAHVGRVSDLAYHNSLMVQVWSMLAAGDTRLARQALAGLPPVPTTAAWITYVRCHDDIGWAISDEDAAAVGARRRRAPALPLRLVRRGVPRLVGRGPGLPAQPGDRRPADQRHRGLPDRGRRATRTPAWRGCSSRTRSSPGGAGCRWSGAATSWPSPTTPPGPTSRATRTTTAGPTARASTPSGGRQRHDLRTIAGRAFTGLAHLARVRAGAAPAARLGAERGRSPTPTTGVLAVLRRHASGPFVGLYNVTPELAPLPAVAAARRRPRHAVRRDRRAPAHRRGRRPGLALAVRRGLGGRGALPAEASDLRPARGVRRTHRPVAYPRTSDSLREGHQDLPRPGQPLHSTS